MVPDSVTARLFTGFSWLSALVLTTGVGIIIGFLAVKGAPSLGIDLIFADTSVRNALLLRQQVFGGLFPAMAGTLFLVLASVGIALPLGLAMGIWLAEYAPPPLKGGLGFMMDVLAGIPSIVVGLFGFSITVFLHRILSGGIYPCLLISALSLAFLVLPYIVKTTQSALEELPLHVRLTAPSLGASKLENITHVLLPASLPDIAGGVVLAIGRCAEDTAVIMLTGVVATAGIPRSIFSNFEALPFYIYYTASEYTDHSELVRAYGAALILLIICTGLFVLAHAVRYWIDQKTRIRH